MAALEFEVVTPIEAIKAFKDRVPMSPAEFAALLAEEKNVAFSVANTTSADMVNDIYNEIDKAIEAGTPLKEFKAGIDEVFDRRGWTKLNPWHLDTVFRQNTQVAYNTGRFEQMNEAGEEAFPLWRFSVIDDPETTDICLQLLGGVYPANDPIFDRYYPPNHFNCRTEVVPISKFKKTKVHKNKLKIIPPEEWDKNPAKRDFAPDTTKYPQPLRGAVDKELKKWR